MPRQTKLIALTNDALGLAAANFSFSVYEMQTVSITSQSVSSVQRELGWQLRVRTMNELVALNPEEVYLTLSARLSDLPQGYSWKISNIKCLFEGPESLHILEFKRDTIHTRFSTSDGYQDYVSRRMQEVWELCEEHYTGVSGIEIKSRRPSLLTLEKVDDCEKLATNTDFLITLFSHLWTENNPLSKEMYELVWKTETQTGAWEYTQIE